MAANQNYIICRKLHLTIESAEDLPNVRDVFKTRAYAKVSIQSDDRKIKWKTKPDKRNGLNPVWNQAKTFDISEASVHNYGLSVVIELYTARTLGDRYIGEVHTTVKDLYDYALSCGSLSVKRQLPIKRGREEVDGILKFCYSFGELFSVEKNDFMRQVIEIGIQVVGSNLIQAVVPIVLSI